MSVGSITAPMFRGHAHSIRIQLVVDDEDQDLVTSPLSTYSHRLMLKLSHLDEDDDAIADLTDIFEDEDDAEKIVEAIIPETATDVEALPEGRTTSVYIQWLTDDGTRSWVVADGKIPVRSVLPRG